MFLFVVGLVCVVFVSECVCESVTLCVCMGGCECVPV